MKMHKDMRINMSDLGDHVGKTLTVVHDLFYFRGGLVSFDGSFVFLEVDDGIIEAVPLHVVKEAELTTFIWVDDE